MDTKDEGVGDEDYLEELSSFLAGCTVDVQSKEGEHEKFCVLTDKDCMDLLHTIEAAGEKKLQKAVEDYHMKAKMDEKKLEQLLIEYKYKEEYEIKGTNLFEIFRDSSLDFESHFRENIRAKIMRLFNDKDDLETGMVVLRASGAKEAPDWLPMAPVSECIIEKRKCTMSRMWNFTFKIRGLNAGEACTYALTWAVREKGFKFMPKWLTKDPRTTSQHASA